MNTFKLYQNEYYKKFPKKSREQYEAELKAFKAKNSLQDKSPQNLNQTSSQKSPEN